MYANKQAVIAKEHSDKELDTAIFFMDMRTYGKDFDITTTAARMTTGCASCAPASIGPADGDRLRIVYASETAITWKSFDMVVLSVGLAPNEEAVAPGENWASTSITTTTPRPIDLAPVATNKEGIYVCGAFQEPKDIPQSVMEASAARRRPPAMLASTPAGR
jgi:heterodisulfide reductase subunit A-like polyferredoxin